MSSKGRFWFASAAWAALAPASAGAVNLEGDVAASVSNDLKYIDNQVSGPGQSNSYLTHGPRFADDWSLRLRTPATAGPEENPGSVVWDAGLDGRVTDDPRQDPQTFSIKQMYLRAVTDKETLWLGDFYADLSSYVLGTSLKGGSYQRKFSDT